MYHPTFNVINLEEYSIGLKVLMTLKGDDIANDIQRRTAVHRYSSAHQSSWNGPVV